MKKNYYLVLILCVVSMNFFAQSQPVLSGKLLYHNYSSYDSWDAEMFILDFSNGSVTNISSSWNIDHEMNGVFSPDGSKVVFMGDVKGGQRNWDIFLWDVGGGEPVNLTSGSSAREEDPKFSPDGSKIIYKVDGDIKEMDLNGNILNQVTNTPSIEESMPYYTTDGNSVLYMQGAGSNADIYIINTDGTNPQPLATAPNNHEYYPITRDASSFFYTRWVNESNYNDQLYLGYIDGLPATNLPFNDINSNYSDATPVGSQYVILSSTRNGGVGGYDLYIADIFTGDIWSLNSYNSSVNSNIEDLGACYFGGAPTTGQTPYLQSPVSLPGTIEAENFDNGGEGIAYHDAVAGNSGNVYRLNEDVDIEECSDNGGGYNVGGTESGEWLEYTVSFSSTGNYIIHTRVATESGGQYKIKLNDADITDITDVPNTGGWQSWSTISSAPVSITAGTKILRFEIITGGFNLNNIEFELEQISEECQIYETPSLIEAENYCSMSGVVEEPCTDVGGGTDIGSINQGDWLEYKVDVLTAGDYTFTFRIATPERRTKLDLQTDGISLAEIALPNTGGWQTWGSTTETVYLQSGVQYIRLSNPGRKGYNINWIDIQPTAMKRTEIKNVLEENLNKGIRIYPNPVVDRLYIDSGNDNGPNHVKIFDLNGKLVFENEVDAGQFLNINYLKSGTYLITINNLKSHIIIKKN